MDGPLEDRSCTDILFLAFFAAFMVGMVRGPLKPVEMLIVTIFSSYSLVWEWTKETLTDSCWELM